MIKKLGFVAVGLLVLLLVFVVAVFLYIDTIARSAIEGGATYALGVPTTLDKADVGVLKGDFTMQGLEVANPPGFESDHFMTLAKGYVSVTLGSLREQTVELPELSLSGIEMVLEKKDGKSNYQVIAGNLKKLESEPQGSTGPKGQEKPGKDFIIRQIVISDVNVQADVTPLGGKLNRVRVPIKEIKLANVGTAEGQGVRMSELSDIIIKAILAAVIANGADFPADLINDLGGNLKGLASLGDMGIQQTVSAAQGAAKAVEDLGKATNPQDIGKGIQNAADEIGGLFKKKK